MISNELIKIYQCLYSHYGPQGWWPVYKSDSDYTSSRKAYHPKNYKIPQTSFESFQIITGAILTQNTNWNNVVRALYNLNKAGINSFNKILTTKDNQLAEYIRPSGYYNQKAKKLKQAAEYFSLLKQRPMRNEILSIWGIGEETADSILLYAFHEPFFVVDAYTKRFLFRKKIIPSTKTDYSKVQSLFIHHFPQDTDQYKEFHALLVQHGKEYCKAKPNCAGCFFSENCPKTDFNDQLSPA